MEEKANTTAFAEALTVNKLCTRIVLHEIFFSNLFDFNVYYRNNRKTRELLAYALLYIRNNTGMPIPDCFTQVAVDFEEASAGKLIALAFQHSEVDGECDMVAMVQKPNGGKRYFVSKYNAENGCCLLTEIDCAGKEVSHHSFADFADFIKIAIST